MARKWRRDQIQQEWTEEQWNEMHKKLEKGETTTVEIDDWNELYDTVKHANDPDVIDWNKKNK